MEFTYTVTGGDGLHYGPIPLDRIKAWVAEGRLNGETQILRSDTEAWQPAANYPELGLGQPTSSLEPPPLPTAANATGTMTANRPIPSTISVPAADPALVKRVKTSADWFYWIAGLSLLQSVLVFTGGGIWFGFGLGVTRIISSLASAMGPGGVIAGLVCNVLLVGLFVVFGFFGRKGHTWAFIAGMALYGLDIIGPALISFWLSVGFHVLALYFIFLGFQACRQLKANTAG